jgi:hypothetical protein
MRRTASVTILLIALTFGAFAAFLARSWLQSHSERTAVKEESTIVVAIRASAPSPSPSTMSVAWRDSYSRATLSMSF